MISIPTVDPHGLAADGVAESSIGSVFKSSEGIVNSGFATRAVAAWIFGFFAPPLFDDLSRSDKRPKSFLSSSGLNKGSVFVPN